MFDKFGEFDSYEEINRAAKAQLEEGDLEAIRTIAEENGLDPEDAEGGGCPADLSGRGVIKRQFPPGGDGDRHRVFQRQPGALCLGRRSVGVREPDVGE